MGGRVAERIVLDTTTSGSEDDLKQATRLARRMVINWGMSEELGPLAFGEDGENVFLGQEIAQRRDYSEETAREIDKEVKRILEDAYDRARGALQDHREGLDKVAQALMEREEIPGEEVLQLLDRQPQEA
jgi:cell division protease FtsH